MTGDLMKVKVSISLEKVYEVFIEADDEQDALDQALSQLDELVENDLEVHVEVVE